MFSHLSFVLTLQKLMPESVLDEEFLTSVKSIDYKSVSAVLPLINVDVSMSSISVLICRMKCSLTKESKNLILINFWLSNVQGTTKINIAVDRLPMFRACSRTDNTAGPEHCGTIHLGADWYALL